VAAFLVAAAVLVAAPRWPIGRRCLHAGAAAFAVGGAVSSASDAWWAWRMLDPVAPEGFAQVALVTATLVELVAAVVAPLLVAVGLVRAGPGSLRRTAWRWIILALGVVALSGGLGLLAREVSMMPTGPGDQL